MSFEQRCRIIVISFCLLIGACGGGSGSNDSPAAVLQSLSISPASPLLKEGATQQFTTTGTYSDGRTANLTTQATWASSSSVVASMSSGGVATALAEGETTITATMGSVTGQTPLHVAGLESMAITPATPSVAVGGTQQLTLHAEYSDGSEADIASGVTWAANLESVATVSTSGLATGVAGGTGTISATYRGKTVSTQLSVALAGGGRINFSPANEARVGTSFTVFAAVAGPVEVASVAASVNVRTVALSQVSDAFCNSVQVPANSNCWRGTLDISGLARGRLPLTITTTDITGGTMTATHAIILDSLPVIQISSPYPFETAHPELRFAATCSDDDPGGCTSLIANLCTRDLYCANPVAQGTASVDATINLSQYNRTAPLYIYFRAVDAGGQSSTIEVPIYVDSSPRLAAAGRAAGPILDADADRLLYLEQGTFDQTPRRLHLIDRDTLADTLIYSDGSRRMYKGLLTPNGVAFAVERSGSTIVVDGKYWEAGTTIDLGDVQGADTLRGRGSYLIWNNGASLFRRNIATQTTITVTTNAANSENDVAANGAVAFWTAPPAPFNVQLFQPNSTTVPLTSDTTFNNYYVLTDGTAVVYAKAPVGGGSTAIYRNTNGVEEELAPARAGDVNRTRDYQVEAGWTAFTKAGPSGVTQIHRRTPAGQLEQLSVFGTNSRLDRLGADGTVTFINAERRYLVLPGTTTPADISSSLGFTIYIAGEPYIVMGSSLFGIP